MPFLHSNLWQEVSAFSWKIVRCSPHPTYAIHKLMGTQRTKANKQAIESLAPRVKALSDSLCTPVSEDDVREEMRRNELEW